jgi:hypothetical protein
MTMTRPISEIQHPDKQTFNNEFDFHIPHSVRWLDRRAHLKFRASVRLHGPRTKTPSSMIGRTPRRRYLGGKDKLNQEKAEIGEIESL